MSLPDIPALPQQPTPDEREHHARMVLIVEQIRAQQATASAAGGFVSPMTLTGEKRREALTWELLKAQPHITGMTELQAVDAAARLADAFVRRFPDAL